MASWASSIPRIGLIIAFQVLPTIIFISAFFAVLYHLGIMQIVIKGMARLMQVTMRISGAESLNVAASIFMGQTEAPLSIRPFLPGATQSELMTIMTSGMAHVSGGIMAAYILYGIEAKHLLAAVIMTAPGTVLMAKMLVPETHTPATLGRVTMPINEEHREENLLGAIARGTIDGGRLAFNVGIMLISFLALIGLLNGMLGGIHNFLGGHHIPFPESLNLDYGFRLRSGRVAYRGSVAQCAPGRQSSGHAHGDQRIGGVCVVGSAEVVARFSVVYDCDVCSVWVRQPEFDWDADWRDRCVGAEPAQRPGAAGIAGHAGGDYG